MRRIDALAQNLRDIEIRSAGDERGHHEGYSQYDLGPATHVIGASAFEHSQLTRKDSYGSFTSSASSLSSFSRPAPSGPALPYSFNLLCKVLRLIPRISAARVLLLFVDSKVLIISRRSASPTVVPTPTRMESASSTDTRIGEWPKPGGKCLVSITGPSQTMTARSSVLRSSRTFPGHP